MAGYEFLIHEIFLIIDEAIIISVKAGDRFQPNSGIKN